MVREDTLGRSLRVKGNFGLLKIGKPNPSKGWKPIMLGARPDLTIFLLGHDELGRPISIPVSFPSK
jgi:hypothetical protein